MKSREGTVVDADNLMDEVRDLAATSTRKKCPELSELQVMERAEKIGLAALKFFILSCILATAAAIPLEDTADVKAAKAMFYKAFEDAEMGKLAELQAPQIPHMYLNDDAAVAAAKPYLADAPEVAAAKPYMADAADVAAAKPYLADAADVAAAKPYLADTAEVAAAKAEFMKYFDAREKGIPATPGALEPVQYAAPVVHHAPITYTYAAPSVYNYALPAYTYANTWAHHAISPYYYAPTTYSHILPYAHIPTVAVKAEEKKME